MSKNIVLTSDNSSTLFSDKFGEHYHSINGALTETMHIFIGFGLRKFENSKINILEIGYGTGLNAICTLKVNEELKNDIFYHGIDVSPLGIETFKGLNYSEKVFNREVDLSDFCLNWNSLLTVKSNFVLLKENVSIFDFVPQINFDIVYFDAFSPEVQPEMWTQDVFQKLSTYLSSGAILLTYCSKGIVKQNLRNSGFIVERLPGPPGKRHVLRATKI